jgi:hypothetical protein
MTNVLLAGFTSHWLRRESSHENRREKTHKRYTVVRSVPSLWSGKREQILLDNKRGWKSTKIRPKVKCFLLTSPLIELFGQFGADLLTATPCGPEAHAPVPAKRMKETAA